MEKRPLKDQMLAKVTLSLVSLIISLATLEGALRLTGVALNYHKQKDYIPYEEEKTYVRDENYESYSSGKKSQTILSIGDSFTNAGNVKSYHSYPYNLYNLFQQEKKPKRVLNMGVCEDSTFGVHDRLKHFLSTNKDPNKSPDKVIILIGAADKFERYEIESDDKHEQNWHEIKEPNWFKKTRLFKVYRHIKLSLLQKYLSQGVSEENLVNNSEFEEIKNHYLFFKEKLKTEQNKSKLNELVKAKRELLPSGFINYSTNLSIHFESASQLTHSLLVYMAKILTTKHRHDLALKWLLDLAIAEPILFWSGEFDDAYFRLVQTYQIQSKYSENEILSILNESKKEVPKISTYENFNEFYTLVNDGEKISQYVDNKRIETWDKIVSLCKKYNITLYVMNYPSDYKSANKIIKQVVEKHKIQFIDNHKFFNKLIKENGRGKYLEDDDHLTPLGYKLMARKVFEAMKNSH